MDVYDPTVVVAMFAFFILVILGAMMLVAVMLGVLRPNEDKSQPYECGIPPTHDARFHASIHYYVLAVSFVIFDIETVVLFIWAVAFDESGWTGTVAALVFLVLMVLGLAYEWKKGGLSWKQVEEEKTAPAVR